MERFVVVLLGWRTVIFSPLNESIGGNQERKKLMSKTTNRGGIALGSIFALVASLFGATPAQAAPSTDAFFITAAGADTSTFATLVDDDFTLIVTRNPSVIGQADMGKLHYSITTTNRSITTTTTYSMNVHTGVAANNSAIDINAQGVNGTLVAGQTIYYNGQPLSFSQRVAVSSTISGTVGPDGAKLAPTYSYVVQPMNPSSTQSNKLAIKLNAADMGTWSPSVTVTVTAFLDENGNNIFDAGSEVSKTQTISFKKYSEVAPSLSISSLEDNTNHATASATLSGINLDQLPGKFAIEFVQWSSSAQVTATSFSARAEQTVTAAKGSSLSDNIKLSQTAKKTNTISARVLYISTSATVLSGASKNVATVMATAVTTPTAARVSAQTLYTVTGANAKPNTFRPNSTFTVRYSASKAVSGAVPVTFTFGNSGSLSTTRTISIDGGTAKATGTASAVTKNLNANGVAEVTITTVGFNNAETVTVTAKAVGLAATSVTVTGDSPDWTLTADSSLIAIAPGGTANVGVTVKDQWLQKSSLTTQRVAFTWNLGYGGTATTSYVALSNGVATAALTHMPATFTGSARVSMQLQNFDAANNRWSNDTAAAVTTNVTVTEVTSGFRTGFTYSYSATISYGTDLSWSAAIGDVYLTVTGSQAVVSGAGLIFKDMDGDTASDTITIGGESTARVQFYVTARKAGTYIMTTTVGSATTTSRIVVAPAQDNAGKTITFDTTNIVPGRTKIVTGTVTDMNGNPVDTSQGGATILVTYTGTAGIPVGSMPTETDADGNFKVSLLTSASDDGAFSLTATYLKIGASTATADKVTKVQEITVGASSVDAADKKITVGSFKGFIAIYTKGYMGQKLSAKVAGKWLVVDPIAAWQGNDYSRAVRLTGAGYTILVHLYIDGEFVRSETIVTK